MGWLKDHPEPAQALMRQNRSYIFFREAAELAPRTAPSAGPAIRSCPAGASRSTARSGPMACRSGSTGNCPLTLDEAEPLRRLMIAQDTGSAIVGPARGDFFFGSGEEAGRRAGLLRHPVRFVVLQPKARS